MAAPSPTPTCRFAPSPNGPLHLGHAYSALRNAAVAARLGGPMLLRMENIDGARCTPEAEQAIWRDLAWLGLSWPRPVRRQSEHIARYAAALDDLAARGLLYRCFCTRGDIVAALRGRPDWPRDPDGAPLYPGTCRTLGAAAAEARLAEGAAFALRLDMARALAMARQPCAWTEFGEDLAPARVTGEPGAWGDAVLRRKDIPATYHIAVVVDDADQGVTDIVRGRDLYAATSLHRLLQQLLGLPELRYHHHRLVLDAAGGKLSKSRRAPSLDGLRRAGATPADILRLIADRLAAPDAWPVAAAQGSRVVSQ